MSHLDDGALRRRLDEPLAISEKHQAHFQGCIHCQERSRVIAESAATAARLLEVEAIQPQPVAALARFRAITAEGESASAGPLQRRLTQLSFRIPRPARPATAVVIAGAMVVVLGAGAGAASLTRVFHPEKVVAIRLSPGGLRGSIRASIPPGRLTWNPAPPSPHPATAAEAAATGLKLPVLGKLPAGISGPPTYQVVDRTTGSYTFAHSLAAPIGGSTLYVTAGPAVLEAYQSDQVQSGSNSPEGAAPQLIVAETTAPSVDSSGASAVQLESFLLSQPGVPADLKAQIRALKDPTAALPIPIPANLASSQPVTVQGVSGVLIDVGFGAGVVWEKHGIIYAVAGQLTPAQVLAIAGSLH